MATIQKQKLSEGLKKRINEANKLYKKAGDVIQDAYHYAVDVDHYSPQEARQILYDNLSCSKQWIRQFLPEEAKMMSNSRTNNNQTTTIATEETEIYDKTPNWNEKKGSIPTQEEMQKDFTEVFNPEKPKDYEAKITLKKAGNFGRELIKAEKRYPRYAEVLFTITDGKITFKVTNL